MKPIETAKGLGVAVPLGVVLDVSLGVPVNVVVGVRDAV